ncbi:hypothetical protein AS038_09070 [Arthrobacter sp. NIO-1057]|nr:hypothetical protein AS038_09070 [Arthrobacter sp. NIO-1057]
MAWYLILAGSLGQLSKRQVSLIEIILNFSSFIVRHCTLGLASEVQVEVAMPLRLIIWLNAQLDAVSALWALYAQDMWLL